METLPHYRKIKVVNQNNFKNELSFTCEQQELQSQDHCFTNISGIQIPYQSFFYNKVHTKIKRLYKNFTVPKPVIINLHHRTLQKPQVVDHTLMLVDGYWYKVPEQLPLPKHSFILSFIIHLSSYRDLFLLFI